MASHRPAQADDFFREIGDKRLGLGIARAEFALGDFSHAIGPIGKSAGAKLQVAIAATRDGASKACLILTATRHARALLKLSSPESARVMARGKTQVHVWFTSVAGRAGAFRRAMSDVCSTPGRAFDWTSRSNRPKADSAKQSRSNRPKADSANPNVSQLLAGTRSGPGRSPGAARVHPCEGRARAPQHSSPLPERLAKRLLKDEVE